MRLSTKLKLSFGILILVPVCLCTAAFFGLFNFKIYTMNLQYNMNETSYDTLINPMMYLSGVAKSAHEKLTAAAESDPNMFRDQSFLDEINQELSAYSAFLIVTEDQICTYGTVANREELVEDLKQVDFDAESPASIYLPEHQVLVDCVRYVTSDRTEGNVYIIMQFGEMVPQIRRLLVDSVVAIVIVLVFTSGLFTVWAYRTTMRPVNKLRLATHNIKNGNLDFDMEVEGNDEFAELCRDFDDMRIRLKENAEEKLAADAENRELISNISHDLKTPITAIKGYVEGIMDGVANTDEKMERYIKIIYSKACDMDTLINELTFYSKIDNNKVPYNFSKVNVLDYFGDCVEEIGTELESRGIELGYNSEVSTDTVIVADAEQLKRVIHNIVGNSMKYMQKQQERISLHLREDKDHVFIAISDNGSGIDKKDLPYIFDRFYRSDASRNSATGGSGIGLSIVKKIIEDHNGTIEAESVPGEGTTMHITLPRYREEENHEQDSDY